uniref:50S ribosomal protein L17 n=1 Tax=Alexandrium catenella TaxID=2925 RepID=A0A7S1PSK9_ALECA
MGFMGTTRFIAKGARSKGRNAYWRKFAPAHKQWPQMKELLDRLIKEQRLELTLPRVKELQQYAEEIVFLAKKNTDYHDGLVDSMIVTPEARQILFERMVPRYQDRRFHFTRVVNQFRYRDRDTTPMGFIEYVDRPGELRPANPVGAARVQLVAQEFLATRRGRRMHLGEMQRILGRDGQPPLDAAVIERCQFECGKRNLAVEALRREATVE